VIIAILVATLIFPFTAIAFVSFAQIFKLYFLPLLFSEYAALCSPSSVLATIACSSSSETVFEIKSFAKILNE
jgi:hypothetical protein